MRPGFWMVLDSHDRSTDQLLERLGRLMPSLGTMSASAAGLLANQLLLEVVHSEPKNHRTATSVLIEIVPLNDRS